MHAGQRRVIIGTGFAAAAGRLSTAVGHGVAWLTALMVVVTFVVVVLRYFFDSGWIWLQELTTFMHALVFLLGAAYTLRCQEHVRVDIIYRRLSDRGQAIVDLAGTVLLLLPFCIFLLASSLGYATESWLHREASREAGGLPYPFVPVLKTAILVMAVLVALQGIAQGIEAALRLAGLGGAPDCASQGGHDL